MRYNIINKSKVIGRNVIKKMWRSIQGKKYEPGVDKRPLRKITNLGEKLSKKIDKTCANLLNHGSISNDLPANNR